jgi:hypothetical protein
MTEASFVERRSGRKDRRKTHTFLLKERRSGCADRRRGAKFKTYMTLSDDDMRRIYDQGDKTNN